MSTQNHEPVRAGAAAVALDVVTGVGSIFWFELSTVNAPECLDADGAKPAMSGQTQAQARHEGSEHTLLYVEDNLANLQLVEQLIARRPDMRLLSAVNGLLGIKMARDNQPDVILMDINLPGINGIEVLRILHEDRATAHIPVVALSANAMPRDIEKGLQAGFFWYLTKPIKIQVFMDVLNRVLGFAEKNSERSK